jgi:hypothetical protein
MVDARDGSRDASVKYITGYLFQELSKHIANAEKIAGLLLHSGTQRNGMHASRSPKKYITGSIFLKRAFPWR